MYKQISKQDYDRIRGQSNFLYLYFIISTDSRISERAFKTTLGYWLSTIGFDNIRGIAAIVKYLDGLDRK